MIDDVTLKIMTQHLGFVNCVLSNYFQTDRVCNIQGAMNVCIHGTSCRSKTEQILYLIFFGILHPLQKCSRYDMCQGACVGRQ